MSVWFVAGWLIGALHATMLWRNVHRFTVWSSLTGLLRLGLVAGLLVIAAIQGAIIATAAGWIIGFIALGTWFMLTSRTIDSSNASPPES